MDDYRICGGVRGKYGCGALLHVSCFHRKGLNNTGEYWRYATTCKLCANARQRYLRNGAEQPLEINENSYNTSRTITPDGLFLED